MKNKKIMSIILAAGMMLSTMSMAVSARVAYGNYLGEDEVFIERDGEVVGEGSFDFGTYSEPGAYASTECEPGMYSGSAVELSSGSYDDMGYNERGGSSAYIAYRSSLSGRSVDCTWTVFRPDSTGTIPSGSPNASNSYTWWDY